MNDMMNSTEHSLLVLEEGLSTESLVSFITTLYEFRSIFVIGDKLIPKNLYEFNKRYSETQFLFIKQETAGLIFLHNLQLQEYPLLNEALNR